MNELERITAVYSSPSAAFKDIARRPVWWAPVALLAIISTIFALAYGSRVGYDRAIRQAIETSPQAQNMTPEQMERAISTGARVAQYSQYGGAIVSILIAVVIVASVFKFLFDVIMGADIGFNRMMAIVAYAQLPMVIATALSLLVLNLKAPEDFNVASPLAFNVGAFLSSDVPAWVRSLGTSIDLFSFWQIGLLAIGVSSASRKVAFGKALATVIFPWALYVILKVAAVALRT